jgi:hypothetical protein
MLVLELIALAVLFLVFWKTRGAPNRRKTRTAAVAIVAVIAALVGIFSSGKNAHQSKTAAKPSKVAKPLPTTTSVPQPLPAEAPVANPAKRNKANARRKKKHAAARPRVKPRSKAHKQVHARTRKRQTPQPRKVVVVAHYAPVPVQHPVHSVAHSVLPRGPAPTRQVVVPRAAPVVRHSAPPPRKRRPKRQYVPLPG